VSARQVTKPHGAGASRGAGERAEAHASEAGESSQAARGGLFVGSPGNGDVRGAARGAWCARRALDFFPNCGALMSSEWPACSFGWLLVAGADLF
jgi:hypothetical protein